MGKARETDDKFGNLQYNQVKETCHALERTCGSKTVRARGRRVEPARLSAYTSPKSEPAATPFAAYVMTVCVCVLLYCMCV